MQRFSKCFLQQIAWWLFFIFNFIIFNVYKSEDDNEDRVGENYLLIYM